MQLRYLQTLTEIGAEQNSTIIFPMPIDIVKPFLESIEKTGKAQAPDGCMRYGPENSNAIALAAMVTERRRSVRHTHRGP